MQKGKEMEYQELLQQRKERGYEIARTKKVVQNKGIWLVPSQTNPHRIYSVELKISGATCTCDDFKERGIRCKHIFSVEFTIRKNKDGSTTITQTKRITYPQNWKAYDKVHLSK